MKIKLNDSLVTHCSVIEFRSGKVFVDGEEIFESDFLESVVRISDDNVTEEDVDNEKA